MDDMFDWNRMRAFLATAEEGSLSAAARKLRLTQPTLGRQIAALEDELGLMLFERVGRGIALTTTGHEMLQHVRAMGAAADKVALVAAGQAQSIDGKVVITASDLMSATHLPAALVRIRTLAPRLKIEVLASNDIQDLMRREADIAIRHVRPDQPDLVARLILEAEAYLYASKDYLDRHGRPKTLAALAEHEFIGMGSDEMMVKYLNGLDIPITQDNFVMGSENGTVSWAMACAGLGIAPMDTVVAALSPKMERVPSDMNPITFPVWLATHREIHTSPRIRLVFDVLADVLGKTGTTKP